MFDGRRNVRAAINQSFFGMPGQADLKVNGVLREMPEVRLQLANLLLKFGL